MKETKISELKAHLSAHIARVRRGETIVIVDRSTPVAQLGPLTEPQAELVVREPRAPLPKKRSRRPRLAEPVDVVTWLREDRDSR